MLLVAAPAMRRGEFTVGDLVLFTTYIDALSGLPRRIGRMLAYKRHASVAMDRHAAARRTSSRTVSRAPSDVPHLDGAPLRRPDVRHARARVPPRRRRRCTACPSIDLTVRYPSSGRGVDGVDLVLDARHGHRDRGRGRVGKEHPGASLARPDRARRAARSRGTATPSTIPARSSCRRGARTCRRCRASSASRSARTCSSARPVSDDAVDAALRLAVLEDDVAEMPHGLDTVLGPRGVRLSGGQLQRAAAARARSCATPSWSWSTTRRARSTSRPRSACGRGSSTEAGRTLLVVSNRPEVVARADQVLVLADGEIANRRQQTA